MAMTHRVVHPQTGSRGHQANDRSDRRGNDPSEEPQHSKGQKEEEDMKRPKHTKKRRNTHLKGHVN
jgi:hypothetical protein